MCNKKTLVIASGNKSKIKEIAKMLPEYNVLGCAELGFTDDIIEDGTTFLENAYIKARTVSRALNLPALADDSGLVVEALGGAPGIYSARYAGDGNDEHNNDLLLKNLEGITNRSAKFVCAMAFCMPNGKSVDAEGETHGKILLGREGKNGFGYDPIFYSDDLKMSMGIASDEQKNSVSHRARALKAIIEKIKMIEG